MLSGTSAVKDEFPYCQPLAQVSTGARTQNLIASFAHYDYLGISSDPRIRAAAVGAIESIGVGAHASRLVGGERSIHRALEHDLAEFLGVEDALSLVSGYGTNVAVVGHLLTAGDLILIDEASHNSILVGGELSRARTIRFRHNDVDHLRSLLNQHRSAFRHALVVVEGLYSMDGDIPDLPAVLELCRSFDAWLMVDEAHSIGVLGKKGRGVSEHFGIPATEIDLIVGTLSKSFLTCGGFVAARRSVIEWLRFTLPGFVYSVGLPPSSAAVTRAAIEIMRSEPERRARLIGNSQYFLSEARARGLDAGKAAGAAIVPILFKDTPTALAAGMAALRAGYFVPPIVQIGVPKNAPRLRFFLTAEHRRSDIDGVLDAIAPVAHAKTVMQDEVRVGVTALGSSATIASLG
jgi:8-amino-7-oxononanoate synthase